METLLVIITYIALVPMMPSYRAHFRGLSCWTYVYEKSYIAKIHEGYATTHNHIYLFIYFGCDGEG